MSKSQSLLKASHLKRNYLVLAMMTIRPREKENETLSATALSLIVSTLLIFFYWLSNHHSFQLFPFVSGALIL